MTDTNYDNMDSKAVELAAASPDPRVRGVAMRRMEIDKERASLDNFLSFYMSESAATSPVPLPASTGARQMTRKAKAKAQGKSVRAKTLRMLDAAKTIIVSSGKPMQLGALHDLMVARYPDLALANPTSLRVRLSGHRDKIVKVDDAGYWPNDHPMPENGELQQNA